MPPLPMTGPRELREITAAFNLMQQRQTDFVSDRTRMLAGIGHDLRTPLTALRLRAELVEDEETRVSMVNNISRMMQLVEETMRFAREDAARAAPFVETDLINLANTLIHEQRELGRDVNWAASKPVGPCLYRCQPVLVRRALVNVVENAFTYGQRARISLQCSAEFLRFIVEDDGPGMSRELLEKATQPFLRGGAQASGGVGLGLAIARSCVKAHGGRLSLSNRPEGGLRVEIALPN